MSGRAPGGDGDPSLTEDPASVEVTVRGIASGGSGVADLPDGRVVFVPRTAPGDRARIRIVKEKRRWALGALERVVAPGPRADAPCALYAECGGCHLQHLPYESQLAWKGRFIADALNRIGPFEGVEAPEVVPSPGQLGYRSRMSFTLRRLRGGRVVAGLHGLGRPAHVVEVVDECLLPEPELSEAWVALRAAWGPGARLLPAGGRLRLTIRTADGGLELLIEGGPAGWKDTELRTALPALSAVRHRPGHDDAEGRGAESPGPGSGAAFEQVNRAAAALLRGHVAELVGDAPEVVDAYCGDGAFAAEIAREGRTITGVELDPEAVEIARARSLVGFTVVEGAVEDRLSEQLPVGLLLVNPPRKGLGAAVTDLVVSRPADRIVYVSCDPATLARDLGALDAAYTLTALRAFDLFPQTAHVETVVVLERREAA